MERKALTILFFTLVLDMIGIGMIIPIVPIIFTDPTSPSFLLAAIAQKYWYFLAGLTIAIFGIMQFFAAPLLGDLSDTYGRKKLLTVGVGVLAVAQLFFAAGVFFVIFPDRTTDIAHWVGVSRGADLLFYSAILFLFFNVWPVQRYAKVIVVQYSKRLTEKKCENYFKTF